MYQLEGKELEEVLKLAFKIDALLNDRQIVVLEEYIKAIQEVRKAKERLSK
jgi:hypothetical protein